MNKLYFNISSTFFIKIIGLFIAFVFQIVLGRILKPELYGKYTMYLTYSTVLSIAAIWGMDRNLIKEVAKSANDNIRTISMLQYSLEISMIITLLISVILLIIKLFIIRDINYLIFILLLTTKVVVSILDGYLQGKGLVVRVTVLNSLINNILKIILFIIFIFLKTDLFLAALLSHLLSEVITIVFRIVDIKKIINDFLKFEIIMERDEKKDFIRYSTKVALLSGIGLMLQNIDKIMISLMLDLSSVGIYKVAINYISLISIFVTPFIAFWPVISKYYYENKIKQIEVEMKKIVKITTNLSIPMFFIFLFKSKELMSIFGKSYSTNEAEIVLMILAFSFLIDAISGPIGAILTMTKYVNYNLYNNILSIVINIVLNYILVQKLGIIGIAIGTGVSVIVSNLISIIEVKYLLGIFSYDYSYLFQIVFISAINLVASNIFANIIKIPSTIINIIVYGTMLYSITLLFIFILNFKKLRNISY